MSQNPVLRCVSVLLVAVLCVLAQAEGVAVTAQRVGELVVDDRQTAPAEVLAANRTDVAAQINARIDRVAVDVGVRVAKGDLLVELDRVGFELAVAQSDANVASLNAQIEQAQAQLARAQLLIEQNFMSREDVQSRATALAVLQGSLAVEEVNRDVAKTDLSRTRIYAPFDGEVAVRAAQRGGYITQGATLLTLIQTDEREVDMQVHPAAVDGLVKASPVLASYGRDYPLRITRVSSVIDPVTQLRGVRLEFVGDEAPVGATGTVSWRSARGLLPARLIERRNGNLGVFVVRGDVAKFVVLPDASEGRATAHALSDDTSIVVDGRTRLQDGDPVSVRAK